MLSFISDIILEPTGEEVHRSSSTISSPSPSLTHDVDESSNSSSIKGSGGGASIGICDNLKREHRLTGSTEILLLTESPKSNRQSRELDNTKVHV